MGEQILNKILTEVQGLTSDVQDLKSNVEGLNCEMQGIQSETKGLKAGMQEMKSDTKGLKAGMQEMKSETKGLKARMQEMKSQMNSRFDTLESRIGSIEIKVDIIHIHSADTSEQLNSISNAQSKQEKVLGSLSLHSLEQEADIRMLKPSE